MARANLKGVKAVSKTAAKNLDVLGNLATYTLPDDPVNGTKLVRIWGKHGLDVDVLPEKRSGAHIFMSACRSVETRRNANGVEIKVDEVLHNNVECVYQITRLVRDKAHQIIEHPKAMTLVYDKKLDQITVRELEDYETLRGLEDAIRKDFAKNQRTVPGPKIRNAVRDTVLTLGAQNLRRKAGGLYFVPSTHRATKPNGSLEDRDSGPMLDGLKGALEELYGERADFYTIPLMRDDEAEQMVAKHFALNIQEASREVMEKAVQRVREGKGNRSVRADLLANLWNERRRIAGAVETFDQLVGIERTEIDKNLRDLDNALAELSNLAA